MNRRKRQQHITTNDIVHHQTKKSKRTVVSTVSTTDTERQSITSFEDLANETIHDILEYLDAYDIHQAFFNLNARFQNLLSYVNVPIRINISNFSKPALEHYYNDFIKPNQHRLKTLHLSDPIIVEYIFPITENISNYSQLQTLYLENIESPFLEDLLHRLAVLSSLSSLILRAGHGAEKANMYNRLFELPALKYCEIISEGYISLELLPLSINTSSPIEYLTIYNDHHGLKIVDTVLSYLPQLRRLRTINEYTNVLVFILLNNSTQLSFPLTDLSSNVFDLFLKKYSHQIKLLHFCIKGTEPGSSIEAWKRTILSYLPYVKTVYFKDWTEIVCDYTLTSCRPVFNHCRGFCRIQQEFFTHEPVSEKILHQTSYLFKSDRKKHYVFNQELISSKAVCHPKDIHRSVRQFFIGNEEIINDCSKSFPDVTELTVNACFYDTCHNLFTNINFQRIIPLTNLKKLTINNLRMHISEIIEILLHTPNIHTLTVSEIYTSVNVVLRSEESEKFHLVSKQNKIKHINIKKYLFRTIKTLIKLCPELQHLTLGTYRQPVEAIVRYLLSENKETPCNVSSLSLSTGEASEQVKSMFESKKHPNEYSFKVLKNGLYVWW